MGQLAARRSCQRLHGAGITWYVTGGWALDLFLGQRTRDHADLEFATLPLDIPKARKALAELEFFCGTQWGTFVSRT